MKRFLLASVVTLIACGGKSTEPGGVLKVGIIAGNNQVASAGTATLGDPIVGQLVRLSDGTVAWHQKAIDAVLPAKAYAQSQTLNGSPVVGAVVCAAPIEGPVKLTPVVACTNTAADGTATFAFTHGNIAGSAKAVVQGMQGSVVATFDTAKATVVAGAAAVYGGWPFARDTAVTVGQVLDFNKFPLTARDAYGNTTTDFVFSYRRVNSDAKLSDADPIISRLVTVRAGDTMIYARADTAQAGGIHLRIVP